jgi:dTDP-4-dehydrorhamnose reductase
MKWLITGGSGQLGLAIQKSLVSRGIDFVVPRSSELDITKPLEVNRWVDYIKPSVVINAAAYTDVDSAETDRATAWKVNVDGARNLALAAKANGAVFAQISTDYVFSGTSNAPYKENDSTAPFNYYGETKAASEQCVTDLYSENSYVFRTAWLYSSFRKNFAKTIAQKAIKGEKVSVVNDQIGQPTFVNDVAEQVINSVVKEIPFGFYHTTNSGAVSWFDFAREIYSSVGTKIEFVEPVSSNDYLSTARRPRYSVLAHSRWTIVGMDEMRNWKLALNEAIPSIIFTIKNEE